MAKKKNVDDNSFIKDLAQNTGGEVLEEIKQSKYYIDSGNLAINYASCGKYIGGGLPGGKIIEVFGPEATAKSLFGNCTLRGCQKMGGIAIHLDCERSANAEFAKQAAHVDSNNLVVFYPVSIEECERKIIAVTKKIREVKGNDIPICFLWDSLTVCQTEREAKEINLPENYTKTEFNKIVGSLERPGERAKAIGDALRALNPFLDSNNCTLFIINQTRQAIGVMFGSDEIIPGGKSLKFYSSSRWRTSANKEIRDERREIPIGVNLKFKNKKNRAFSPGYEVSGIQLFYSHGINPLGGLLGSLINAGRIEGNGKGTYKVCEPWAGGRDIVFRASKEANTVALDVLLDCPSLIDGNTKQDVLDYISDFRSALELATGGSISEVDTEDEGPEDIA